MYIRRYLPTYVPVHTYKDCVVCMIAEMMGSGAWMGKDSWNETWDCFLRSERSLSVPVEMVFPLCQ